MGSGFLYPVFSTLVQNWNFTKNHHQGEDEKYKLHSYFSRAIICKSVHSSLQMPTWKFPIKPLYSD